MATRLSVITTRTGDQGTTGLGDGTRVSKDDTRIQAMGDVDELNSIIGLWRTETLPDNINDLLSRVQHDLFDLGAELCIPGHVAMTQTHVTYLENALAQHNAGLGKLDEFILPGGIRAAAIAHVARTVARRAERSVIRLHRTDTESPQGANCGVNEPVRHYLNRLSDLCFVLARALNKAANQSDILWQRS